MAATIATLALFSRPYVTLRPSVPVRSIAMGVLVFAAWIAPDLLFGYRHSLLFGNALTRSAPTATYRSLAE